MDELMQAEMAVQQIGKKDLSEVRAYANPSQGIKSVMEAIAILLQEKQDWSGIKKNVLK